MSSATDDLPTNPGDFAVPHQLMLHSKNKKDMSIQGRERIPFRPATNYQTGAGDIRFRVPGNAEQYWNPAQTYLTFGVQILTGAGGNLGVANTMGAINNAHSVFQSLTVILGNQTISMDANYAFKAYLTNLLS